MKLFQPRVYTFSTGLVLFAVGFLGFAFRVFDVPDKYLMLSLALGFWGLVVATKK